MAGLFKTLLAKAGNKLVEAREARTKRADELHREQIRDSREFEQQRLEDYRRTEDDFREQQEREQQQARQRQRDQEEHRRREDEAGRGY